jgi:uncharacterized protein (DUF2062 family)
MARRLIRRFLPDAERIRAHKHLRFLGERLQQPHLWHLNRHSVPKAFALGLFMAFMPIPIQTIPAAALAFYLRANLPVTLVLVWLTNPLTMAPAFLLCYSVGALVLRRPIQPVNFEISFAWLGEEFLQIWEPFLLGCFVVGGSLALIGYYGMRWLWRWYVLHEWEKRRARRAATQRMGS